MQQNEYHPAEVTEIGEAEEIICGQKLCFPFVDSSSGEPFDRMWEWWGTA